MLIEDDNESEAEVAESSENLDTITQTILLITRLLTEADQPIAIVNQAPQAMQDVRRQTRQGFKLSKMNIQVFSRRVSTVELLLGFIQCFSAHQRNHNGCSEIAIFRGIVKRRCSQNYRPFDNYRCKLRGSQKRTSNKVCQP